jgi:hypothetical protein
MCVVIFCEIHHTFVRPVAQAAFPEPARFDTCPGAFSTLPATLATGDDAMSTEQESRRCVVWFGQPTDHERARLTRAGWRIRVADARTRAGVGMRRDDLVVALADLR